MSELTARGVATRARIVEGAAWAIRELGIDMTLDDVRARTRTSKGQIFHYFPGGKEELLFAVAQHEAARVLADQEPELSRLDTVASWRAWAGLVVARYREQGAHCPLSVILGQLGRTTPGSRAITATLVAEWSARLAEGVRRLNRGGIAASIDPESFAAALVAGIQGGVAIMMATGEFGYLEAVLDGALDRLGARERAALQPG